MALGETLKLLRKERRLTQKDIASAFGTSESVISLYESNKRSPSYDFLLKFADYYGVSTDYLLGHSAFVVGPQTIGQAKKLRQGLVKTENTALLRKRMAEVMLNQSLLSDKQIWSLRENILGMAEE